MIALITVTPHEINPSKSRGKRIMLKINVGEEKDVCLEVKRVSVHAMYIMYIFFSPKTSSIPRGDIYPFQFF